MAGPSRAGAGAGAEPYRDRAALPGPADPTARFSPAPARHFDTSTTEPISFFLSGLEELLAWQPDGNDDFNVAAVPLAQRQPPLHSRRPRTLVCHDMRGGYLEDRCVLPGTGCGGRALQDCRARSQPTARQGFWGSAPELCGVLGWS